MSRALILLVVFAGCAERPVRPDEMSAEAHRREAAQERALADDHRARFDPNASVIAPAHLDGPNASFLFPFEIYHPFNPTVGELGAAEEHDQHARQHERAAAELEAFEAAECREFPPATRAACPFFGATARVDDLADGVRIHPAPGVPLDALYAHVRCHLAYARTRGFGPTADCPLYIAGTEARLVDGAVELFSRDQRVARRLQTLARSR